MPNQPALELVPSLFFAVSPENYMFTGGCNNTEKWTYTPDFTIPQSYLDFLRNNSNFSADPNAILQNATGLSNYTDTITDFTLMSPAPFDYLTSLYRPCGIASSELDPDTCSATLDGTCSGEPGLKCRSVCGDCQGNDSYFPSRAPTCFAGSQTGYLHSCS